VLLLLLLNMRCDENAVAEGPYTTSHAVPTGRTQLDIESKTDFAEIDDDILSGKCC
jgi:hypothetical protein